MKDKIGLCFYCHHLVLLFFLYSLPLIAQRTNEERISLLDELKCYDLSFFHEKWKASDEENRLTIVKEQKKLFSNLFSKFEMEPNGLIDFSLLVKLSRVTPLSAPYQLKLLNYISKQERGKMKYYFEMLLPFLPDFIPSQIRYTISDNGDTYLVYNRQILACYFTAELIKMKLASLEPLYLTMISEQFASMLKKIDTFGIECSSATLTLNNRELDFKLHLKSPQTNIFLSKELILVEIGACLPIKLSESEIKALRQE